MIGSLYSGISGLNASSSAMSVIGDNIANVSTTGFKSSAMSFSSLFSQSLGEASIDTAGSGVSVAAITENWTSGSFENTGNATDLAISGKGLFVLENDDGAQYYSRAGNFHFNSSGELVNPEGLNVLGYAIDEDGALGPLGDINIAGNNTYRNQETSEMAIGLNLDSESAAGVTHSTIITINDSLGNDIPLTITYTKIDGDNAWAAEPSISSETGSAGITVAANVLAAAESVSAAVAGVAAGGSAADASAAALGAYNLIANDANSTNAEKYAALKVYQSVTAVEDAGGTLAEAQAAADSADDQANLNFFALNFDFDGKLTNGSDEVINLTLSNGAVANQAITFDLVDDTGAVTGDIKGLPNPTSNNSQSQDGYPAGILQSVSVDATGVVTGSYSNGQRIDLYRLVLADFPSYQGLSKVGNNLYTASRASGQANIAVVGQGRLGDLTPSALELSNVDLATEFVKMITTQRAYQANSRVVSTSDELLNELINLKR